MRLIDAELICDKCGLRGCYNCTLCKVGTAPTVDAVILPFKLGDKAFWACHLVNKVLPFTVDSFILQDGELFVMGTRGEGEFPWKECSLTREEAEAALAKIGGEKDG